VPAECTDEMACETIKVVWPIRLSTFNNAINAAGDLRAAYLGAVLNDAPIPHMISVARALGEHNTMVFVSGRSDEYRTHTEHWPYGVFV